MTTAIWDLPRIRAHIATHLPLAEMMGLEVTQAGAARSLVRLAGQGHLLRPGGAVAGPVLFAMADTAAYALTIALQHTDRAVTAGMHIVFLRPAFGAVLLAEAVPLRAGRRLISLDVRIWAEETGPERPIAQATAQWVMADWASAG